MGFSVANTLRFHRIEVLCLMNWFQKDDYPLASLPLLGYTVSFPNETDNVMKDFVFKLQFKNHVYFLRTDNQYSLER